ncbi:MAG: 16S rRNA (cytosine(1402)-N(4))-methyltransferase RsmH [Candidatus Pacebacteria bacterium]|nr:16S rRNA (cytosine(1402)-N(4))-methyltransferase RsmH [Candidatus Paceibacterota bacterium]NCS86725.1 16S rRNA (cytosine(1402)-N(4))-methyltransferase RsmH [Candidatus Paceibacterota bacterium]
MTANTHITVLLEEATKALLVKKDHWYIDATFGKGGHTQKILNAGGKVIAFDIDKAAISSGKEIFASSIVPGNLILIRENFAQIFPVIQSLKEDRQINEIDGVLFDFGTSTEQLKSEDRGFSFDGDSPLDMRMDDRLGVQAKDLLALIPADQLEELFRDLGGETDARKIARAIKSSPVPITTTKQLSNLILKISGKQKGKLHPATKVFQALRIAVNTELENIMMGLPQALEILAQKGRIVTIAFHEGEDREVKTTFKLWEAENKGENLTKKPVVPTAEEIKNNPRSRSAKMRIFEKNTSDQQKLDQQTNEIE